MIRGQMLPIEVESRQCPVRWSRTPDTAGAVTIFGVAMAALSAVRGFYYLVRFR